MSIGDMTERLIVQKRADTRDDYGDPVPAWTEYARRWAKLTFRSGGERFDNRQEAQQSDYLGEMRYLPGARTKWRALWRTGEKTHLTAACTATGTTLYVDSDDEFPNDAPYLVQVADEVIEVTSGFGSTTWTVERGKDGTTAAVHGNNRDVYLLSVLDIESVWHEKRRTTYMGLNEGELGRGV